MTQAEENGRSWARAKHALFCLWLAAHAVGIRQGRVSQWEGFSEYATHGPQKRATRLTEAREHSWELMGSCGTLRSYKYLLSHAGSEGL